MIVEVLQMIGEVLHTAALVLLGVAFIVHVRKHR